MQPSTAPPAAALPPRMLSSVVLPLPDGPISASTSPGDADPDIPPSISRGEPFPATLYFTSANCHARRRLDTKLFRCATCMHAWRCVLSIVFYLEVYRQGRLGHQFLAPCAGFDVHCCGRAGRIYMHAYATVVRAG
uniref:Uncharacterized protein n=1 Tax=Zea mays TaxID=4577 RepID=A0A804LDW8_MAIZE